MPRRLDFVANSVAAQLMDATASTAAEASRQALANLVEQFDADVGFLRHNDHNIRASKLIAEWQPRPNRPDPDPLEVVHFTSDDPVFAYCAHGKKPVVIQLDPTNYVYRAYQGRIAKKPPRRVALGCRRTAGFGGVTTGLLGFIKFGGRKWTPKLINTLGAVAPMFAQLQARIVGEERLRYLAEHDDLTGLHNRRSLVAHLSERLAAGRPGPVAVLYFDLDRLKSINDYFGHPAGDFYLQVFAARLRASVGGLGVIGQIGGDEFLVIPTETMPTETAESFADRLRTTRNASNQDAREN